MGQDRTVLIVDEESFGRELVETALTPQGYRLVFAVSGIEALAKAAEALPDLILLNVKMPGMITVCRQLRAGAMLAATPVVMVTEAGDRDARLLGVEAGADDFVSKPLDVVELRARVKTMTQLSRFRRQAEEQTVRRSESEAIGALDATLEAWARALELRDVETEGHSERVTDMAFQLARAMGMSDAELVHVRRGALLHDIGKMGVPDRISFKLGPLDEDEWEEVRKHPIYAYELLYPIEYLRPALDIPYCHHEWWDGTGYPRGLKGESIPLAARIFAVVDVWDALHSDRSWRRAWSQSEVDDYIHEKAGTHFDPDVVQVLFSLFQ